MEPLRLVLIGHGRWGHNIERTLKGFSDVSLSILSRGEHLPPHTDGVLIATPASTHANIALPFIEKGIPTYIEKPMTDSILDAVRIKRAAEASRGIVFVGHIYLYHPAIRAMFSHISSIGDIARIDMEGVNDLVRSDTDVLWDWLPHHLAVGKELLGKNADTVEIHVDTDKEVHAAITTFMFGNIPLVSRASWLSPEKRRTIHITGERGSLFFDDTIEQKISLTTDISATTHLRYESKPPLEVEMRAFVDSIVHHKTDRPHIAESVDIVRMIDAAHHAVGKGRITIDYGSF